MLQRNVVILRALKWGSKIEDNMKIQQCIKIHIRTHILVETSYLDSWKGKDENLFTLFDKPNYTNIVIVHKTQHTKHKHII